MLNYQTTSFHDALYARRVLGLKPAPEFAAWLQQMEIFLPHTQAQFQLNPALAPAFNNAMLRLS
jgi:ethanolamine ammonia-lyase large subunit